MNERILLVEGHPNWTAVVSNVFRESGVNIPEMRCAPRATAVQAVTNWQPTHVFAPFDGSDSATEAAFRSLRDRYPGVPLIALCTTGDAILLQTAQAAGADDALLPDELLPAVVRRILRHYPRQQDAPRQAREDLYYHLFHDAPHPMWLYDRQTLKFLLVNRAAQRQYGYSEAEFLETLTILDIRPEEDRAVFLEQLQQGFSGGDTDFYDGVWRHRHRDGSVFHTRICSQDTVYNGIPCRTVLIIDVHKSYLVEQQNRLLSQQVQAQKRQMDEMLDSVSEVVWSASAADWTLLYINRACEHIYGHSVEELMAGTVSFFDSLHPDDRAHVNEQLARLFTEDALQLRYRIQTKDGTTKHLLSNLSLVRDANGVPQTVNGVDTDITAQHLAELANQRVANELQAVLDTITDGFITLDRDWNFTFVNQEFERVCRMSRQDVLGRNYWDIFPKATGLKFYTEYNRAVHDRVSVHFEEYASSFSAWIAVSAYPTDTGLTIYFHDITEEKALRDRIRRDEEYLKALIDNTEDMIWSVDLECRLLTSNEAFRQIHAQALGRPLYPGDRVLQQHALSDEDISRWRGYYYRAFAGQTFSVVETLVYGDGTVQKNDVQFRPIRNEHGIPVGASAFSRNITEQLRYQQAIEQQNDRLRRIAWVQSHEVRGPLASILGSVALLSLDDALESHTREELLDGLRDAAHRLDQVIRDIDRMTTTAVF